MKSTTIALKSETKNRLVAIGKKGQTFDEIVNLVLDGAFR